MAITVDGLVSGLDTTGIITKLMDLEARPIKLIENQNTLIEDKLAAWQEVNTKLLNFETASQKMNSAGEFQGIKGSFTNSDPALSNDIVSLTVSSNVNPGTYDFTVTQLAKQQKTMSNQGFTSLSETINMQDLSITTSNGTTTFNENTLEGLRSAINGANIGITATIVNTSSGSTPDYRLLMTSSETGTDAGFTVSTQQLQGPVGPLPLGLTFSTTQSAQDAIVSIDGLSATRSSNSFTDLLEGVSFTLSGTGSGQVAFESDVDSVVNNVQNFVDSYNDLISDIETKSLYNTSTGETGILFGNSTLRNIALQLRTIVTGTIPGHTTSSTYNSLSQIGIKTNSEYLLDLDTSKLTQALRGNASAVTGLFTSSGSGTYSFTSATGDTVPGRWETEVTADENGNKLLRMRLQGDAGTVLENAVGQIITIGGTTNPWINLEQIGNFWGGPKGSDLEGFMLRAPYSTLTEGDTGYMSISLGVAEQVAYKAGFFTEFSTQGAIYNERVHLETENKKNNDTISDMERRISIKKQALTEKFTRLETTLSRLKSEGDYLTQQLAGLTGLSKK